jgi:RimJ/RimL family protein N-acetyltransferase
MSAGAGPCSLALCRSQVRASGRAANAGRVLAWRLASHLLRPVMSAIETARLLLRPWHDDDLERLVALYSDLQVARFLNVDGRPWPRERSVGAFEHLRGEWQEHSFGPWAAIDKHTGRWLGRSG